MGQMGSDKISGFGDNDKELEFLDVAEFSVPPPKKIEAWVDNIRYHYEKHIDGTRHHFLT